MKHLGNITRIHGGEIEPFCVAVTMHRFSEGANAYRLYQRR